MIFLMWLACPKAPVLPLAVDWSEQPHLPSPTAGTYALAPSDPPDRAIASVVSGKHYDASLAGAAAGLALRITAGEGNLTSPELRDAAFRAGWPYPVLAAQAWNGAANQPPPPGVEAWVRDVPVTASVGLVRARGEQETQLWLGLVSDPRLDIGIVPRQLPTGGTLSLPALPGTEIWVADPLGNLDHGTLDVPFTRTTDVEGEWLVEVRDARGPIASFPVYVGMVPPNLALLVPSQPPTNWQDADDLTVGLVEDLRNAYGMRMYGTDPLLDAALKASVDAPTFDTRAVALQVGVEPGSLWRWECRSATIEGCLDQILWDVRARPGLLVDHGVYARHVELNTKGVRILLMVAGL
ncbi:MAG: hypothetical protein R3F59_35775 [Myxococcota bacterium]